MLFGALRGLLKIYGEVRTSSRSSLPHTAAPTGYVTHKNNVQITRSSISPQQSTFLNLVHVKSGTSNQWRKHGLFDKWYWDKRVDIWKK